MSKYIDLNEATDLFKGIDATMTGGWVADTLEALPTIDIVTCEECKHNDCERILAMSTCYGEIEEHAELNSCSHGERIEEL